MGRGKGGAEHCSECPQCGMQLPPFTSLELSPPAPPRNGSPSTPVPAVLKVCSLEQQQRHHLKTCQQCKFSDLPLDGWVRISGGGAQQSVLTTFKKA